MNRTTKSKIQYMLIFIALLIIALFTILRLYNMNLLIFISIIPIVFLVPGRIQGYYYKDFFRGRRLLVAKDFKASIEYNNKFLSDIRLHTWRKKLIWLSWGMYSKDIEAMALNNLGTSYLYLGEYNTAEGYFNDSIKLDSLYPIPYFNLGILETIKDDKKNAENFYKKSVELGFKGTSFDKLIQIGQQVLANIEGK